jgi:type II secretory pathway component PulF
MERMREYTYRALSEAGTTVSGTIKAESEEMAKQLIASQGFIPGAVKAKGGMGSDDLSSLHMRLTKVKPPDLLLFTKQFRTMFKAGISIVSLLEVLETQTENQKLRAIAARMAQDIKSGSALHQAFRKHPDVFSTLYCSMVQAGEMSGALPEVLDRLIYIIAHEHKVRKDIVSALTYPIMVVVAMFLAFLVLLTYVVPKFVTIFQKSGIELPLPTQICMVLYAFLRDYWAVIVLVLVGLITGTVLLLRTPKGRLMRDTLLLKLPIVGQVFRKAAMSRFASIFSILQASGVTVLEAITILSGTIGNEAIAREFDRLRERLEEGRGISTPLRTSKYFPPLVYNMIAVGEESGNLEEMLHEISAHYDYEVEYAVSRMSDMLGPVLIVGLAAVVGFFALAIFLPMWDLTKIVKR